VSEGVRDDELRAAVREYVVAWSHVALDLGDQAQELAVAVNAAASW